MTAAGRLLVATPALLDPNFYRTVVFLAEHNEDGALGVVLNRPVDAADVAEFLPAWADLAVGPSVVFVGGPVERDIAIGVAQRSAPASDDWQPIASGLGLIDLGRAPIDYPGTAAVRVFSGYAGWTGDQLEDEIEEGAWFVVDAAADDVFSAEPGSLWRRVLRRQGGRLALFADFPHDPSLN